MTDGPYEGDSEPQVTWNPELDIAAEAETSNGSGETKPKPKIVDYHGFLDFEVMQDSNLVKHAMRELRLLGEEQSTIDGYLNMIEIFANMGHSGGSAPMFIQILNDLLQFHNLKPLTDDPAEWIQVENEMWQNSRRNDAFSSDGGKHYYLLDEARQLGIPDARITHTSEEYI